MINSRKKIMTMVESGQISAAEGEKLLAAIEKPRSPGVFSLLTNPFEYLSYRTMTFVTISVVILSIVLAIFTQLRFDGILDIHQSPVAVNLWTALWDQWASWLLAGLIFWAAIKLFTGQGRLRDVLVALGVARTVKIVSGLVVFLLMPDVAAQMELSGSLQANADLSSPVMIKLIGGSLAVLLVEIWFITLLVGLFRHLTGFHGWKLAWTFVVTLLAAEVAGKILLSLFV